MSNRPSVDYPAKARRLKKFAWLSGAVIALTFLASIASGNVLAAGLTAACGLATIAFYCAAIHKLKKAQTAGPGRLANPRAPSRSKAA